jgi:hypothetical protein
VSCCRRIYVSERESLHFRPKALKQKDADGHFPPLAAIGNAYSLWCEKLNVRKR